MKTDIVQKTILLNANNEMLLLRRGKNDVRRPSQWDFPGGLLDEGELLEEGVIREIREESGIEASETKLVFAKTEISDWTDEGGAHEVNTIRLYYVVRTDSTKVRLSSEHSEFVWVELQKALELLEYHRHQDVLRYILGNNIML